MNAYHYLFGPVPSRRYGRSLGVDLAVPKTCTLDCRFCQLGTTPHATLTRTDTPPMDAILAELRQWLAQEGRKEEGRSEKGGGLDFITASGSGEPTLHLRFGDLFRFVRAETPYRSLLLSNGSLFYLPEVRQDAALADVVKISLHAWDQASFERVSRPHPSLRFDAILDGYRAFRQNFAGRLDLEVFIIPGLNDRDDQVQRIAELARGFAPDAITLNTAVRPPADSGVTACPPERLHDLSAFFGSAAHTSGTEPTLASRELNAEALVALVERHPLSLGVLATTFGRSEDDLRAVIEPLARQGRLRLFESQGTHFVAGESK
ncbi:MAG TPA: radical SAM protein [Kiritimatiellia bacterium]|nr:radical SAM protein [Kiritimatiellia bacterium]HRU70292.1 radical SAM protein [Kiritimatiellia bacterium]